MKYRYFFSRFALLCVAFLSVSSLSAQQTYNEMEQLTVNENVTTMITAPEPIHLVDISTDKVVGDKPIDNVIRLKPKDGGHSDGEVIAIVTVVTERFRSQYALIYTSVLEEAVADKEILLSERNSFKNPVVSMSTEEMVRYARHNVYTVGEYFFIDFSVENRTNLRFDIDELRVKLIDKKASKATNVQTVEVTPTLVLDKSEFFRHGYRNVIVLKKMTFPDEKVLVIELSEKQISGRTVSMSINYEDILAADSFSTLLLNEE